MVTLKCIKFQRASRSEHFFLNFQWKTILICFKCVTYSDLLIYYIMHFEIPALLSISYDFMISVYQEKFHFRIWSKKYFKTLKTHCINCYSLENIFLITGKKFSMTGKWPRNDRELFSSMKTVTLIFVLIIFLIIFYIVDVLSWL